MFQILRIIRKIEGFYSFFVGLSPSLISIVLVIAIKFYTYRNYKCFFLKYLGYRKDIAVIYIIAIAFTSVVISTTINLI